MGVNPARSTILLEEQVQGAMWFRTQLSMRPGGRTILPCLGSRILGLQELSAKLTGARCELDTEDTQARTGSPRDLGARR